MSDKKVFEGAIVAWCNTYGLIATSGGPRKRFQFSPKGVEPDWRGSRAWAFSQHIPVRFEVTQRMDKKRGLEEVATNVRPVFEMSEPGNLETYSEISTVATKGSGFVFLKRPCGDLLFLHKNGCLEQYRDRWGLLVEGVPVYHKISYDESRDSWQASSAELYSAEELDAFFNQTEVEPESVEFEPTEPELVIETEERFEPELETVLAPATRNKPLIQIVLEKRRRA